MGELYKPYEGIEWFEVGKHYKNITWHEPKKCISITEIGNGFYEISFENDHDPWHRTKNDDDLGRLWYEIKD